MTERRSGSRSGERSASRATAAGVVLLDTNALFLPFRDRFPLLEEIARLTAPAPVLLPQSVLAELDRLVTRRVSGANIARKFAERFPVAVASGRGDRGLLALAVRRRATVVTSDRELRRRLLEVGVPVLSPRGSVRLARFEPSGAAPPRRRRPPPVHRIISSRRREPR